MEHPLLSFPNWIRILLAPFALCLLLTGCKEPVPNPELRDPIYGDLKAQLTSTVADVEAEKKSIEDLKGAMPKMDVMGVEIRASRRQLQKREKRLSELEQMKLYYDIRIEQRKAFCEKDYMRAFEADLPWPSPQEFSRYKEIKKLRVASRNWDDRVPKNTRNLRQPAGAEKAAEKPKKEEHEKPAH